jgi:hypothetical protein
MSTPIASSAEDDPKNSSSADRVRVQLISKLTEAEEATNAANLAKQRADATDDLEEKAVVLEEAAKQDKRAKAAMKAANRLQSGVWQGGAGGAGIGAGVGAGVGTLVGTIVGGVASVPTTGLGLLVGAGTGAVHGPWIKIKRENEDSADEKNTIEEDEKTHSSTERS